MSPLPYFITTALALSISTICNAGPNQDAKAVAQEIAGSTNVNPTHMDAAKVQDNIGYSADIPETSMQHGTMAGAAEAKRSSSDTAEIVDLSFEAREKFVITPKDTWLGKAKHAQENPEDYVDFLKGQTECKEEANPDLTTQHEELCDTYIETTEHPCTVGRVVEVKAEHSYECPKERQSTLKNCNKQLKLKCNHTSTCHASGIVAGTVATDMSWDYNNNTHLLTLGTIAGDYWRGSCAVFERTTTFTVKNKATIQEFRILDVGFDDYIQIKLNNHNIYVGPHGGTTLEVENGQVYTGKTYQRTSHGQTHTYHQLSNCELSTDWRPTLNTDLLPYLQEGQNTLVMKVVVAGAGEGWMRIRATQECCDSWQETWDEQCAGS